MTSQPSTITSARVLLQARVAALRAERDRVLTELVDTRR